MVQKLAAQGLVTHRPYGPIALSEAGEKPDAAGNVEREPFVLLGAAPAGHVGRVLQVSDRDSDVLRALEAAGVAVGTTVTVRDAAALVVGAAEVAMPAAAADTVWLSA